MTTINYWTEEELDYLRANWKTMSSGQISDKLGRARGGVCRQAKHLGLTKGGHQTGGRRLNDELPDWQPRQLPSLPKLRFMGER